MRRALAIALLINFFIIGTTLAAGVPGLDSGYITGELVNITPEKTVTVPAANPTSTAGINATSGATSPISGAGSTKKAEPATIKVPANLIISSEGQLYKFDVAAQAELLIDGLPAKITDFRAGLLVKSQVEGQKVVFLEAYSNEQPGYISTSQKTRIATVLGFDGNSGEVRVRIAEKQTSFPITPDIIISEKGASISAAQLSVGDRVKLIYDENGDVARIEVEGHSVMIKELIKGRLAKVDTLSSKLNLENVKAYRNGQWSDYSGTLQLPYNSQVPVYIGSKALSPVNLKYYIGKDVYAALGTSMGRDRIKKMVVKSTNEMVFSSTIYELNWSRDSFSIKNETNIALSEGTIIIQNGRLVDSNALDNRCQAVVIAGKTSDRLAANVISILGQNLNNSPLGDFHLYFGKIDERDLNTLRLSGVHNLDTNGWESGGDYEFSYGIDSIIYDITGQKFITYRQFYNGDYNDYYGYFHTEGTAITTMAVQRNKLYAEDDSTSYGIIASTARSDSTGWTMTLNNMCDWSSNDSAWRERDGDVQVNLATALIIKDNESIKASSLVAGDRVLLIRTGYRGRVVFVK